MIALLKAVVIAATTVLLATMSWAAPAEDPRFSYTSAFTAAKTFMSDCVGIACAPTAEFDAARRAAHDDQAIVPYLLERYQQAPRAAQVYIALVVRAHDGAKGQALLQELAQAKGETVQTMFGCIIGPQRLDQFAGHYLREPNFRFD
jgi:hypothetical protein